MHHAASTERYHRMHLPSLWARLRRRRRTKRSHMPQSELADALPAQNTPPSAACRDVWLVVVVVVVVVLLLLLVVEVACADGGWGARPRVSTTLVP